MSVSSSNNLPRGSTVSRKSLRSGKSLGEKIRELGFTYRRERTSTWVSSQEIDIKHEFNYSSHYSIMTPDLNLEQITYFQPELAIEESAPGKYVYKITNVDSKTKGPNEILRISDIEVKSYKPRKKMKFRRKKRQSSIISRVEDILYQGKPITVSKNPSEESVYIEPRPPERKVNINDLPENILLKIFSLFNLQEKNLLLSRVCKSWYYLLKDPVFWTELDFRGSRASKETIITLIRRYPLIKKLRLTEVPEVDVILLELCRCNHNVTNLGVKRCDINSHDFSRIILHVVSCCTNLEILDIKGMRFQSDRFFLEIGRLKNLKSLNLSGNKMLRSHDLITLSVNCRSLQDLRILDIALENGQGCLRDEDLTFIVLHLQQNLKTLKLDMQQLRNVSYQAILKCSGLVCLCMINCLYLSGDTFRQFPTLKNLRRLKFTRAINLKREDFEFVFENDNMSKIEELDINGCWGVGDIGIQAITRRLTSLKSLSLKNCKSIKGHHLTYLSQCPELTHLNIAHTEIESHHLLPLCQHVKALSSLVVDTGVCEKSIIQQLQKFFPQLKIIISYSEFQKNERQLQINQPSTHNETV